MSTTPNTGDPHQHDTSGGNTTSVPASAAPEVGKTLPAETVLYLLDTCPEGIKATFVRGLSAAYETGRLSNGEDRYWAGYLDGARDQGASD